MVEIAFERVQNPWVGGKMITESRDTIEGKKKKKERGWSKRKPCGEYSQLLSASNKRGGGRTKSSWNCSNGLYL